MEEGVWGCFWIISGHRACQWRRFGSARCFVVFLCRGLVFIFFVARGGGKGEVGRGRGEGRAGDGMGGM